MKGELWLGSLGLRTLGRDCVSRVVVVGRALSPPKNGSLLRDSAFWAFIWVCCLQKEGRGRWRWQDEASPFQARQLLTGARPLTVASPSIYLPLKDPLLPLRTCQPSSLLLYLTVFGAHKPPCALRHALRAPQWSSSAPGW